jgi:hypothetical protein
MCVSLAPERLDGFYSRSAFKCSTIIGEHEYEHPVSKNNGPSRGPLNNKIAIFSKTTLTILIKFQKFMEAICPDETA